MTINFEVTEKDYINFNLHHMKTLKFTKIFNILFHLVALLLAYRIVSNVPSFAVLEGFAAYIIFFIFLALLWIAFYFLFSYILFKELTTVFMRQSIKALLKKGTYNDFIGYQTLILHEDFLESANEHTNSQIKYSYIDKIYFDYGCLFIYLGAIKAIIVPAAAFSSDAQRQEFLALLKEKTNLDVIYSKRGG